MALFRFQCPACGAALDDPGQGSTIRCPYCSASVVAPPEVIAARAVTLDRINQSAMGNYGAAILESQENWIRVKRGSVPALCQAITAHADLCVATVPQSGTVVVNQSASGFFVLRFPDGIPTYRFLNLIGWLNDPPEVAGVSDAMGWYKSPGTNVKYALYPDPDNHLGDTLTGYNRQNQAVSVYLPDAGLCEISRPVAVYEEPALNQLGLKEQARVKVIFDADNSFGNPNFVMTHAIDHAW